jgi:hypothetical protein
MAIGQQRVQKNLEAFHTWVANQSDENFTQITLKGCLFMNQYTPMEKG